MLDFTWGDLLNNLTQIGLTVSAVALLLFLLRKTLKKRYPARAMCLVWAVLALRLLVPVQLTLPDPPVQVAPRTTYLTRTDFAPAQLEQAGLPVLELDGEITTDRWVTQQQAQALTPNDMPSLISFDLGRLLAIVWIAGVLIFASWQLYHYLTFHYVLKKSSHPAERDMLLAVFAGQKQSLGITRDIQLRVTPTADCPMLAGFLRPALYLPDEALDAQDAAFIFRHELTHYKRGDLWLKLALVAARAVHWFNPLVHLLARFAQEDIELACDDAVVRGMDVAARRAYGETILRSVEAQVKKRALVSCFTGDKEGLMRRFEGLFDKNVKKRGMALVVAAAVLVGTLGCAFSVGESKDKLTEETRRALADEWAQSANPQYGYTVKLDGENTYVLFDHTNTVMWGEQVRQSVPSRKCWQLFFENADGDWRVSNEVQIAEHDVTSLDEFRLLYENDLGFPDFLMVDWTDPLLDISEPDQAARNLLRLSGNSMGGSSKDIAGDDIWDVTIMFPDYSEVTITMVNQFDAGWLPQDYTYDGGKNARTAADLAGQYARGVMHKSGQYIYPILTAQKQEEFLIDRPLPDGGFNWKYGGSSPSYRGYTLVPVDDPGSYLAVFQMYGGGVEDMRSAFLVSTAQSDGRRVIQSVTEVAASNYTKSDLFKLYYDSGLPWPTIPEGAENFNGASLDTLTRVRDAVETVFNYFGENVEHIEGNVHQITLESWFKSEVISEGDTEAVVRLTFVDNSPSVDVQMRKTDGYWLPVGLVTQFDENFHAYQVEGDDPTSQGALPVGATIAQAIENANGDIPLLEAGQTIKLEPVDGKLSACDATLTDAVIRADGTLQYTDRETQQANIRFTDVYGRGSAVYLYQVEHLTAEALSSTYPAENYRGVTVAYTANGTDYTAAFVYRLANGDAATPDYTITSTEYHNDTYGYTLTLPDCFVGQGYVKENDDMVKFGLQNALPGISDDPTNGGAVMWLDIQATAVLKAQFGEDWQAGYPVPCKELAERDSLTYYLAFASDVQYDPSDEEITAAYTEMSAAAYAMGADAISFDGQTDAQRDAARTLLLHDLAMQYAYTLTRRDGSTIDTVTAEPDLTDGSCLLTVQYIDRTHTRFFTVSQQLWYEGTDSITPMRTETLVDTSDGIDARADFLLAFPQGQGIPVMDRTGIDALLAAPTSNPEQDAERVLGLSGGTGEDFVHHPINQRVTFTYRWPDGTVDFTMQGVKLGSAEEPVYLPVGYNGFVWEGDPYTYMMCVEKNDFSMCSVQALVAYLAQSDGAYTENILSELDEVWQLGLNEEKAEVETAIAASSAEVQSLWASHKAANPDIFGARFTDDEIEAAYQAVREYAKANDFSVENLWYDANRDIGTSQDIMQGGVLQDNVQNDGLTIDNVITVIGDAHFGETAWRDKAEGYSFTLYRGADGKWVLEDGAYGY